MTKPTKINFTRWATLQTGNISSIHHGRASLRVEGRLFVMRGPLGLHQMDMMQTDQPRLDAHWQQFARANA